MLYSISIIDFQVPEIITSGTFKHSTIKTEREVKNIIMDYIDYNHIFDIEIESNKITAEIGIDPHTYYDITIIPIT